MTKWYVTVCVVVAGCSQSTPTESIAPAEKQAPVARPVPAATAEPAAGRVPPKRAPKRIEVPALGRPNAPVVIVKFTDFQCPFCAKFAPILEQAVADNPGLVRLEYRHFPLSFHRTAESAALATMAAHRQGQFFAMARKVYANLQKQEPADLEAYATEAGLHLARFRADMADPELLRYVRRDAAAGTKVGVAGTPTVFINGAKFEERSVEALTAEIRREAAVVRKLVAKGATLTAARRARMAENGGAAYVNYVLLRDPIDVDMTPWKPPPRPPPDPPDLVVYDAKIVPGAPILGPPDAPVTVLVCADFQCPFSARNAETLRKVVTAYPRDVRLVFHNRPMDFHPRAVAAARAAMAAHRQGKFWEMHDKLFADRAALEDSHFARYAAELGLDLVKFQADGASDAVADDVRKQDHACVRASALGTPSHFVNGRSLYGAKPFDDFKVLVDEQLKLAKGELAKGVAPQALYEHLLKIGETSRPRPFADGPAETIDIAGSPVDGPSTAAATLVVFSEFECPFCSRVVTPVSDAKAALGGQLRVVFKHFPLAFHKSARAAAAASIAAQRQGKFWPFYDRLFANQKELGDADLLEWARLEGLDLARFEADRNDPAITAQIDKDIAEGQRLGVQGVPTFFLNGRRLLQPPPFGDALVEIVRKEILGLP